MLSILNYNKRLTNATYDDWEGWYLDGKLIAEGHTVTANQLLEALKVETNSIDIQGEWLEMQGSLPHNESEVRQLEDLDTEAE